MYTAGCCESEWLEGGKMTEGYTREPMLPHCFSAPHNVDDQLVDTHNYGWSVFCQHMGVVSSFYEAWNKKQNFLSCPVLYYAKDRKISSV